MLQTSSTSRARCEDTNEVHRRAGSRDTPRRQPNSSFRRTGFILELRRTRPAITEVVKPKMGPDQPAIAHIQFHQPTDKFCATGRPGISKSNVCWDPLQHLERKASKASPSYTTVPTICVPQLALSARIHFQFPHPLRRFSPTLHKVIRTDPKPNLSAYPQITPQVTFSCVVRNGHATDERATRWRRQRRLTS